MVTSGLVAEVRRHAGLDADSVGPATISGALARKGDVDAAVESFLVTLQHVNVELNGAASSASVRGRERVLPAGLVYAVAEVARMLRDEGHPDAAWSVDSAWLAVLAGDIDNVPEHVAL